MFLSSSLKSNQSGVLLKKHIQCLTVHATIAPSMSPRNSFQGNKKKWLCNLWWNWLISLPQLEEMCWWCQPCLWFSEAYRLFAQEERHQEVSKIVYPKRITCFCSWEEEVWRWSLEQQELQNTSNWLSTISEAWKI